MLSVIIVDDEPKAIEALKWQLNEYCDGVNILETFTNPKDTIRYVGSNYVDCVFLDVEMPIMDGFTFLRHFEARDFKVVFITAYDRYAIQAIRHNAMDYLLKPINSEDLINTINRLKIDKIKTNPSAHLSETVDLPKRLAVSTEGRLIYLNYEDILFCQSDGNYCRINLISGKSLMISKKIKDIQELLCSTLFYRVHNSYLINMEKVKEYLRAEGYVILENEVKIPVSRRKKAEFLSRMS